MFTSRFTSALSAFEVVTANALYKLLAYLVMLTIKMCCYCEYYRFGFCCNGVF